MAGMLEALQAEMERHLLAGRHERVEQIKAEIAALVGRRAAPVETAVAAPVESAQAAPAPEAAVSGPVETA